MEWRKKVQEVMRVRRMNQSDLARESGITISTLHSILTRSEPGVSRAKAIAEALGVSMEWLFDQSRGMDALEVNTPAPVAVNHRQQDEASAERCRRQLRAMVDLLTADDLDAMLAAWYGVQAAARARIDTSGRWLADHRERVA